MQNVIGVRYCAQMISALESVEQGHGLYSFGEVARYLHLPPSTLRSWFRPYTGRKPILKSQIKFEDDGGLWLSFNDFIEAWIVAYLKKEGAKPKAVREALNRCQQEWGIKYPLSRKGTLVWVDKSTGQVVIKREGEEHPFDGTGPHRNQLTHYSLIQDYLSKLEFDEQDNANRYIVWEDKLDGQTKRVVMQPTINFGEPTVEGTPYRALTLKEAAEAEGSPEEAARLYEVDRGDVVIAIEAFKKASELREAA